MSALFIPAKIRVGYQERHDTFTGKLAYVIYFDDKGKLRKEKSWTSWCSSNLGSVDIDNIPTKFTFNKGVKRYSGWNGSGRNMVRVYDHRDFEFEITVDNLLGILHHSVVDHSDIHQECVYAWNGTELVLLPTNSVEYQESVKYTAGLSNKISAKDLIVGATYQSKARDGDKCVYLGKHEWANLRTDYWRINSSTKMFEKGYYNDGSVYGERSTIQPGKHVYWNIDRNQYETIMPSKMSTCIDNTTHPDLSTLLHNYNTLLDSLKYKPITHEQLSREIRSNRSYQAAQNSGFISVTDITDNVSIAFNIIDDEYNYSTHKRNNKFVYGPLNELIPAKIKFDYAYHESMLTKPFLTYAPADVDTTVGTYISVNDIAFHVRSVVTSGCADDIVLFNDAILWKTIWYAHPSYIAYSPSTSEYKILTDGTRSTSQIHKLIVDTVKNRYHITSHSWITPNSQQIRQFIDELVHNLVFVAIQDVNDQRVQMRLTFVNVDTLLALVAKHFPTGSINVSELYPRN